MLAKSGFAILVMTAEDETAKGTYHPRLNVVHEAALFQGKLGFERAIVLLEDDTEEFSNIAGIQQVRFAKGNIKETYGDVLATLRRCRPARQRVRDLRLRDRRRRGRGRSGDRALGVPEPTGHRRRRDPSNEGMRPQG